MLLADHGQIFGLVTAQTLFVKNSRTQEVMLTTHEADLARIYCDACRVRDVVKFGSDEADHFEIEQAPATLVYSTAPVGQPFAG